MKRAIIIALSGLLYFILSVMLFIPFRMKPIVNYNLFIFPLFVAVFLFLFYKTCTVQEEKRAYIYAFFTGTLMWQVIGEMSSLRVTEGLILQFSDVNIKTIGGYLYVLAGWVLLFIMWKTQTVKKQVLFCFMIFIGIWNIELYLDNYSSSIPVELMPKVANAIAAVFVILSGIVLYCAKKSDSAVRQIVFGGLLYLTVSVILMALTQWQKPQTFYLLHERTAIEQEIQAMQEDLLYIDELKKQLGIGDSASVSDQLGLKDSGK
jgi:hypothetical protein